MHIPVTLVVPDRVCEIIPPIIRPGAHKRREAPTRSVQHRTIAWNSDALTTAARLCPYLDHSCVTVATEATHDACTCSNCPRQSIWSMAERSKFLFN